ncbi:MAG: SAM-dependent chlorinase/fluorinase [Algicola sp.]|nr:SAM-dependent chlorinase/fluorinase [Algicola sp.]
MKQYSKLFLVTFLCVSISGCARLTTQEKVSWDNAYDSSTKERFIPVELFTGLEWDGKHELILKEVSTTACASVSGRQRPCDNIYVTGPFKTAINNTSIEWAGNEVSYYRRTFSVRGGQVESFFTINNSRDGLVRIYDKRKKWGARTYNGLGSKFPLGYWKQGEVRSYASRRPTSIEIIELDGPNHCLTFRWIIGVGKGRNSDNNYTFCPDRGFTNIRHNNTVEQVGPKLPAIVGSLAHQQATVNNGIIKGNIPILDRKLGNVWTNIHQDSLKQAGIKLGDTLCVLVKEGNITKLNTKLPYLASFGKVAVGEPLVYVNSLLNVSFALNHANFSAKHHIAAGAQWSAQIEQCN